MEKVSAWFAVCLPALMDSFSIWRPFGFCGGVDDIFVSSCLNEILNASWQVMDFHRDTAQSARYCPQPQACTLSHCPQGKGTGCLWLLRRHVWVMWAKSQNAHEKTREWGEMVCLTSLISQNDKVYNLFFFFFLESVRNVGIYGWQQIPYFVRYFEAFMIYHPEILVLQGSGFLWCLIWMMCKISVVLDT